jgi:hypothetical protein
VRIGGSRCALYGLLFNLQGDRARVFAGYGFDRDKMMLLSNAQEPARDDIHETQLPIAIDVEVCHLTDLSTPGVKDVFLAEFVVRGARMLVVLQPDQVHGDLLPFGGEERPLTALLHSVVRSHQTVRTAGCPLL